MNKQQLVQLKEKIINRNYSISHNDAKSLIETDEKELLYKLSNEIRIKFCNNKIDICSITNAKSGKCPENCKWCAQSSHNNSTIEIYDLIDKKSAVENAVKNYNSGVHRHSLVTSGKRATDKQIEDYIEIYNEIKKRCNIKLCASLGLINKLQLIKLKNVGISKYHCNIETAPSFFNTLCSSHTIEEKFETIKYAQEVGLDVCSGVIIGMGENMGHRIEMAFTLRELSIKSIPINIFMPVEGTKIEKYTKLTDDEILTTIALFRFINPDAYLRIAGGRILIKHLEKQILNSGINASIVGDLLTTVGSSVDEDMQLFKKQGFEF